MKIHLPFHLTLCTLILALLCASPAFAQDDSGGGSRSAIFSSLSKEDKMKLLKARREVLANNPDLKAEQEGLAKQREELKDGSDDDKKILFQNLMAHEKKMRAAMLQVDPTLQPIFDQIDQAMKEKFQQRAASAGGN